MPNPCNDFSFFSDIHTPYTDPSKVRIIITFLIIFLLNQYALGQSTNTNTSKNRNSNWIDYGKKATGVKPKKKTERKPRRLNRSEDAFASKSNTHKNTSSNTVKGKHHKAKKNNKLLGFLHLKPKEEKEMDKESTSSSASFTTSRKEKKAMKKQKNKRDYGLGLPKK
jgi:hypothetical protein